MQPERVAEYSIGKTRVCVCMSPLSVLFFSSTYRLQKQEDKDKISSSHK